MQKSHLDLDKYLLNFPENICKPVHQKYSTTFKINIVIPQLTYFPRNFLNLFVIYVKVQLQSDIPWGKHLVQKKYRKYK